MTIKKPSCPPIFMLLNSGFTLIEILIALLILSVIMIVLLNSLTSSMKTIEVVESTMTEMQETRRFIDILCRELESTIFKQNDDRTLFRFTERDHYGMPVSEIQFLSLSTTSRGTFVIVYKTEVTNNTIKIYKKMYPPTTNPEDIQWEEVMSNVLGFSIMAYNSKGELVKNWDSSISRSIPEEVKITLFIKSNPNSQDKETITISEIARTRINKPL